VLTNQQHSEWRWHPKLRGVCEMAKTTILLTVLCVSLAAMSQTTDSNQSEGADQHHSKTNKNEITARGCVTKQNSDYILTQAEEGNSYELQGSGKLRLKRYLGQEVEVSGVSSPSMSTSSDFLARTGSPSPVTITVTSVKTIAKQCSGR
jgi:cellobiose phosphorylase